MAEPRRLPPRLVLPALGLALLAVTVLALGSGQIAVPWSHLLHPAALTGPERLVVVELRLPRVLTAALVGAGLAGAGAALQALFRNPLAEPALIGVSAGAALGAALVIVAGGGLALGLGALSPPALAASAGGLLTTLAVMRLARVDGVVQVATLLLAGVAINALVGACTGLLAWAADDPALRALTLWLLGSFAGAGWPTVVLCALGVLVPLAGLLRAAPALNLLLLGEAEAGHLGVAVERLKRGVVLATALMVGVSVAAAGVIGFVGLVVPHLLRLTGGPDHRVLLPGAALLGALLLVAADTLARQLAAPAELPVGLLTALVGGPFFFALLLGQRGRLLS